ncbi:MAG TPA: hypothetical protein VH209_08335 [Steroidobacteraceae bacterium]|nr:hypothetical protein [Steroidobacteraceae bacterium]
MGDRDLDTSWLEPRAVRLCWQASLSGSNLAGKVYYVTERNQLSTYDEVDGQPGRPREFLISVRKVF